MRTSSLYRDLKQAQETIEQAIEYIGELEVKADLLDDELKEAYQRLKELARGQG